MRLNWVVLALTLSSAGFASQVTSVDAVALSVGDLDRSVEFYTHVLPFHKVSETEITGADYERLFGVFGLRVRVARLKLGDESIELRQFLAPEGRPVPVDFKSNDRWFQHFAIIVSDMDKAYALLRKNHVRHASTGPQRLPDWNKNAGGIQAFYFKDPDGHPIEILQFPADKGNPKWRQKKGLFLGIDHTAIVVHSTEDSLRFYRDVLGLKVRGESENCGTEQEHLNNVAGAELRITGLGAATGPGVEFLEYVVPSDGRPAPADLAANDLVSTETILTTRDAAVDARDLQAAHAVLVSSGAVPVSDTALGIKAGVLVKDPDGHAVLVVEKR